MECSNQTRLVTAKEPCKDAHNKAGSTSGVVLWKTAIDAEPENEDVVTLSMPQEVGRTSRNIQFVPAVIRERVLGDFVETGVWRVVPVFLCAPYLKLLVTKSGNRVYGIRTRSAGSM